MFVLRSQQLSAVRLKSRDKLLLFLIDSNLWIVSSTFDLETLHSNKGLLILIKLSIIVFMVVELSLAEAES